MISKGKSPMQKPKFLILSFSFAFFLLLFALTCYAKEITILYTGDTHAMLYPCSCPREPDGGVSRRAALIKRLKKTYPEALLLDSGGFFAGGLMDEHTQNTQLDRERTIVNLKAIELMQYDALAIGDDEFNFGREFFRENIGKANLSFLSCNISGENPGVKPYIIKQVSQAKIGIIGVTTPLASQKSEGILFSEPKPAVAEAVRQLRKDNVDIVVLLSHLGESEGLNLINEVKGIDILITGHTRSNEPASSTVGDTLVLRPSWQARRLGKLTFSVKENKPVNYKAEELRLSEEIPDDPGILSILPRCFSDGDCRKGALSGNCAKAGRMDSECLFAQANKVGLLVITSRACRVCDTETVINLLRRLFPGLSVSYLYYPDKKAQGLVRDFSVSGLPAYFLGKEAEKEDKFDSLKGNLDPKGDFYMLKPQFSGVSYLPNRQKLSQKLDVFLSLYDKDTAGLLEVIKEFNPAIHFLAVEKENKFEAPKGGLEVEEDLRALCVKKHFPQKFWDYISCRAKNINSSWWDDCALGIDTKIIKSCAVSQEGSSLLKENINLNKEVQAMFGPVYLLDNQEIFATQGLPAKSDLEKIIKR